MSIQSEVNDLGVTWIWWSVYICICLYTFFCFLSKCFEINPVYKSSFLFLFERKRLKLITHKITSFFWRNLESRGKMTFWNNNYSTNQSDVHEFSVTWNRWIIYIYVYIHFCFLLNFFLKIISFRSSFLFNSFAWKEEIEVNFSENHFLYWRKLESNFMR